MTATRTATDVLSMADGGVLSVERRRDQDAATALTLLGQGAIAIGWSARTAGFIIGAPPDDIYEMRAFDTSTEVRWHRDPDGTSRTVVIREADPTSDGLRFERRVIGARMMVWGTGVGRPAVRSRQVGELTTPVDVPDGAHLVIRVVEYLGRHPDSGTAIVIEERLSGMDVVSARTGGT